MCNYIYFIIFILIIYTKFIFAQTIETITNPAIGSWLYYSSKDSTLSFINYPSFIKREYYSVAVDSANIKCFGSRNALVTFDGKSWGKKQLWEEDWIHINDITRIVVDNHNILWFRNNWKEVFGLNYDVIMAYNGNQFVDYPDSNYSAIFCPGHAECWRVFLNCLKVDYKGRKWVSHEVYGIVSFDDTVWVRHFNIYGTINVSWGKKVGGAYDIAIDKNDVVWYTASEGAWRLNDKEPFISSLYTTDVYTVDVDPDNIKWFSGNGAIWRYDDVKLDFFYLVPYQDNIKIKKTVFGKYGEKWFLTDTCLFCYDDTNWYQYDFAPHIMLPLDYSGETPTAVDCAVDLDGVVWICLTGGIILGFDPYNVTAVEQEPQFLPLIRGYPNPFNPSTTIEFTLPEEGFTAVYIYNMSGQKIRELASERMTAGTHWLQWDGKNDSGGSVSAGVYIARLKAGGVIATGKLLLVK